jgi:glycosyltransferase involved in cell wall biosynthesis
VTDGSTAARTDDRRVRVLALYHRAETFGGSFNSVLDVLTRTDRARFDVIAGVPGSGNVERQLQSAGLRVLHEAEQPGARAFAYASAVVRCAWRLRRQRIGLLYVSDYVCWRSSALAAARLAGVPRVVHVRAPLSSETLDPELLAATIVIGNSAATIRALDDRLPADRRRVVHNFIETEPFAAGRDIRETFFGGRPPVVGFVGVFRPEKGIEYFLEMARIIAAERREVRLLAVGGESAVQDIGWVARMKTYARDLGVEHVVHFAGSRSDIPDVMRSIDVLVVPSLNEGFGRVIIEANAAGTPAVGAEAAGIPEVIEDGVTGLLVPPRDPAAMAAACLRLLDDREWRERLRGALPQWVAERFSPATQLRLIESAWNDAIRGV